MITMLLLHSKHTRLSAHMKRGYTFLLIEWNFEHVAPLSNVGSMKPPGLHKNYVHVRIYILVSVTIYDEVKLPKEHSNCCQLKL